jgi:hypothetical protein
MNRRVLIYLSDDVVEGLAAIDFAHQLALQRPTDILFISPEPLRAIFEPFCHLCFGSNTEFKILNFNYSSTFAVRVKQALSHLFYFQSWDLVLVAGAEVSSSWSLPIFSPADRVFFIRSGDGYFKALAELQLRYWCEARPMDLEALGVQIQSEIAPEKTIKSRIMLDLSEPAPADASFWAEFIFCLIGKGALLEGKTVLVFAGEGETDMLNALASNLPLGQIEIAGDCGVLSRLQIVSQIDIWVGSNPLNGYLAHCLNKKVIFPFDDGPPWQDLYPERSPRRDGIYVPRANLNELSQLIATIFLSRTNARETY